MQTVTQVVKVPTVFKPRLDGLLVGAFEAVKLMLSDRAKTSSKFYPGIPCVIAKSLVTKYQRNPRCREE
jgi:hypothetical protein